MAEETGTPQEQEAPPTPPAKAAPAKPEPKAAAPPRELPSEEEIAAWIQGADLPSLANLFNNLIIKKYDALVMQIKKAELVPQHWQVIASTEAPDEAAFDSLPAVAIRVMGPPPTSGTRDAFVELVMEEGCRHFEAVVAIGESDGDRFESICASTREDGAFIEAGENDNLIVQKLEADPDAFGIFGFSFLDQNINKIQGSMMNGVEPTFDNIAFGDYPVSRSLYFYVKNAHLDLVPGIAEFVAEFTSEDAWGPFGYLADKGLIPLPDHDRAAMAESANSATPLSM